ncbi:MAG: phosphonate ABC transporter, permease protein PhnE [Pseudomonadota bacterium]|nr:phosphonate ABC transporter, permease protein PhnE [Pseudomonadota bacterium]
MSDTSAMPATAGPQHVERVVRRGSLLPMAIAAAVAAYLVYTWFAFGMTGILLNANVDKGILLISDAVTHKIHVTRLNRSNELTVAIEGERTAEYTALPDWVTGTPQHFRVDLGDGYEVRVDGPVVAFDMPGYGTAVATITEHGIDTRLPDGAEPMPYPQMSIADVKFEARPTFGRRVQVTRGKVEVHRYQWGWENFFFPWRSPLAHMSFSELFDAAFSDQRIDPEMSNARLILTTFWANPDWQHGIIVVAVFETLLMAVLGTLTAVILALPLSFIAAGNFTPSKALRVVVRRVFDFVRGIDNLIWSLIFIRAFGLGPLTGALAIAITDTGTLGKMFSEALENVDNRQIEGVQSTGARTLQKYRFGVIPQILPVLVSQSLYYLESNTRSATVIGALGAGGIGLVLVETMRTQRDWENVFYIIVIVILLVMAMDTVSGWLRRKLIVGRDG